MVPMRLPMFENLVDQAWQELPARFRDRLDNVFIVVEDFANPHTLKLAGIGHPAALLGFYHGVPLTARKTNYGMVAPDKISLYRIPILQQCQAPEEVPLLIRRVLRHEIAHYFGIDDDRLEEIGAY